MSMKTIIFDMFQQTGTVEFGDVFLNILMSAIIGLVVYFSYYISHAGTIYSKKFNVTLIMMTVLTTTVVTVISTNIALSLGMVGALSIIRFRTAIKDSRDTSYIFWSIIVGICCGVGSFSVAAAGTGVVFILMLLLGRIRNDNRMLIIIRASKESERKVQSIVFDYFERKAVLRVKNTTKTSSEFIYEISKNVLDKYTDKNEDDLTELIYDIGGIEYINMVTQNDEVSS